MVEGFVVRQMSRDILTVHIYYVRTYKCSEREREKKREEEPHHTKKYIHTTNKKQQQRKKHNKRMDAQPTQNTPLLLSPNIKYITLQAHI